MAIISWWATKYLYKSVSIRIHARYTDLNNDNALRTVAAKSFD